jgi:hypothetical protein
VILEKIYYHQLVGMQTEDSLEDPKLFVAVEFDVSSLKRASLTGSRQRLHLLG